ncbi:MAG: patatin-like phospholipase family protein [Elusimicrobia bacterium]|nr:patatin-like phospholipase family protein [Elusimicrobiota bacterium]
MKKFKIGLALGGGGARGLAHIGVLRVLEKNGIIPDIVTGTSMGAIIGAMYCYGLCADEIEKKLKEFMDTDIYKDLKFESVPQDKSKNFIKNIYNKIKQKMIFYLSSVKIAFLEKSALDSMIAYFLPDIDFCDLKIPFACVAVDISHNKEIVMKEGPIWEAVLSSISIPGVMPPVKVKGHIFVDGGAVQMIPLNAVRDMGCDFSIGVDVSADIPEISENDLRNAFDITHHTSDIALSVLKQIQIKDADFLLSPPVGGIKWFELKRFSECIIAGEKETIAKIPELKNRIKSKRSRTFLKRIF